MLPPWTINAQTTPRTRRLSQASTRLIASKKRTEGKDNQELAGAGQLIQACFYVNNRPSRDSRLLG